MKKALVIALVVSAFVLALAATAYAGVTWCATDPHIQLPGSGGVVHLVVAVPAEYSDTGFTLDVWAPEGSRLVGGGGPVNVTVVLHEWKPTNQIKARVKVDFPVSLAAKYGGQELGTFVFEDGRGTATWSW